MTWPFIALVSGLLLLVWSAERFVEGSAATARHLGMPALLIGMVVVGFGTSAPEMVVSALAALQNNPGIALGNAYGSNISNIALILGATALIRPVAVHSRILHKELPLLLVATGIAAWQIRDGRIDRLDTLVLLCLFVGLMGWMIWEGLQERDRVYAKEIEQELKAHDMPIGKALFWVFAGLLLLIASSRLLVWGAVEIALGFGISELVVGLTIVAVGTSLPELASSLIASRKGEDDIALGNIMGSNLFNTLAVVGIAGMIAPMDVEPVVLQRDMLVMSSLTFSLFILGRGFRGKGGRISRLDGGLLLACYAGYTAYLVGTAF